MSFHVANQFRVRTGRLGSDDSIGNNGLFIVKSMKCTRHINCIVSDGMGWEHVSVTIAGADRCPTWKEMCFIKSWFWDDDDCVLQFHPPEGEYVNHHKYCLHLWREIGVKVSLPPSIMVGPKS